MPPSETDPRPTPRRGGRNLELLILPALLVAWFVLQIWVLPRLGVPTCALPPGYGRDNPHFEFTQHAFRGHPDRRREYLAHITRELGLDNPFVRHMAQELHDVDVRQWRWQRAYDREQRRRQAGT